MSPLSVHGSGLAKRLQANVNTANVVVERSGQDSSSAAERGSAQKKGGGDLNRSISKHAMLRGAVATHC